MAADPGTTLTTAPDGGDSSSQPLPPSAVPSAGGQNSSGFYRRQGDALQFAANAVHAPGYTLNRNDRARIALPKDGWDWFDSREAAYAHHGLPLAAAAPEPEPRTWRRERDQPGAPASARRLAP